jgi:hypothetical protein
VMRTTVAARTRHCRQRRCGRTWDTGPCGSPRGHGGSGGTQMAVVNDELAKEARGREAVTRGRS